LLEVQGKDIKLYLDRGLDFEATHPNCSKQEVGEYLSDFKKNGQGLMEEMDNTEPTKKMKE
jgi:hypothetical protein